MGSKLWNLYKREISVFAVFTFLYQFIFVTRGLVFGVYKGIPAVVYSLVILTAGYFTAGSIAGKKRNYRTMLISYLCSGAAGVIAALVSGLLVPGSQPLDTILTVFNDSMIRALFILFEGLAGAMLFFAGVRMRFLSNDEIMSMKTITFGIVVFIASVLLFHNSPFGAEHKPFVYAFAYIFAVLSLLIKNQQNLDNAFIKKHIDLSTVPKNIRNYNSRVILLVFAVILLIFNIDTVAGAIMYVISNIPRYIVTFMLFLLELVSKLFPGETSEAGSQGGGGMDLSGLPDGQENPFWSFVTKMIFIIILGLAAIYVITRAPNMARAIKRKINELFDRIRIFFRSLFKVQKDKELKEADYVDETETIKPVIDKKNKKETERKLHKMSGRIWKNADPEKKIRFMYSLTVRNIANSGINISRADTPRQIKEKCQGNKDMNSSLEYNTDLYEKVRYGNIKTEESEFTRYKMEFDRLLEILKNNR